VIVATIALTAACRPSHPDASAIREYVAEVKAWSPTEAETGRTVDRILATHFVDEAEVRRQIMADTPRVAAHLDHLSRTAPSDPALRRIHERYLQGWRELLEGYQAILAGLDEGRAQELAVGRRAMEAWRQSIWDTARDLRALRNETGPLTEPKPKTDVQTSTAQPLAEAEPYSD